LRPESFEKQRMKNSPYHWFGMRRIGRGIRRGEDCMATITDTLMK